jgi:hypothetical protein
MEIDPILPANSEFVTTPLKKLGKLTKIRRHKTKRPNGPASGRFPIG